jgi:uncharacterized protein
MIVNVRVIPKSSRARVSEEDGWLKVHLTRPAQDGEANEQLIALLADYYKTKKYRISIRTGHTSRTKQVQVDD